MHLPDAFTGFFCRDFFVDIPVNTCYNFVDIAICKQKENRTDFPSVPEKQNRKEQQKE